MFNDVLAMEYLMKNKKYSNADHIWGSGMRITHMFFGLIISFLDTFYEIVISRHNNQKVHRVNRKKEQDPMVLQCNGFFNFGCSFRGFPRGSEVF